MAKSKVKNALSVLQLDESSAKVLANELKSLDHNINLKITKIMLKTGMDFVKSLEFVVTRNPILWAKVYLDWEARGYQRAMLIEGARGRLTVFRLGRRLGKCLPGNTLIPDSVTGEYLTVEELFKRQKANIYSLNGDNIIENNNTNIIFENGVKPVYRVTTKNGRKIEATGNHPLYTINGWAEIDELKIGDHIGIAYNTKHSSPTAMNENEIKFAAYILGDGNCTRGMLRFSCDKSNTKVLDEMRDICSYFNCDLKKDKSIYNCDFRITTKKEFKIGKAHNKARTFLRKDGIGIWGHSSHTKTIPTDIFKLDNKQLSLFLSRLYATDGWASLRNRKDREKKGFEIGYCTVSEKMATQLQSLLLRFNVNSTVRKKKVKYNGGINIAYVVEVLNVQDAINFCNEIGIYSKEEAVSKVLNEASNTINYGRKVPGEVIRYIAESADINGVSKQELRNETGFRQDKVYKTVFDSKVKRACEYIGDSKLRKYYDNNIIWDEIVSIEYIGDMPTYDLTVPNLHNFVANDFITHNTDVMCVLILWYACTQINKGPNDQYDILIFTPYETQIDLIFKRLDQLIKNSPYLLNLISREIHHKKEFSNGTNILGLTAGASSGASGSNNSRGQRADLIVIDESDYIGSSQITNFMNIRNEAPERIRMIAASTPSGKHEEFYKWCTGATITYEPKQEDIDNYTFSEYVVTDSRKNGDNGNGWTQVYAPSIVNKELLKINPTTEQTYLQDIKEELSELRYEQEVMANFGDEELGVYQRKFIENAIGLGISYKHSYIDINNIKQIQNFNRNRHGVLALGVKTNNYKSVA